jgi:hypothetical protein
MAGSARLSREWDRDPSSLVSHFRAGELIFGVVCLLVLATLAIVVALTFPDLERTTIDFLAAP